MRYWTCGSGYVGLQLKLSDACGASHQGRCDEDVRDLSIVPYVRKQLDALSPGGVRDELREYGAWDAEELADHEQNLQRIVWLAAGDISEKAFQRHPQLMRGL